MATFQHKDKRLRKYVADLVRAGWTVIGQSKHFKMRSPKGSLLTMSISPSCPHVLNHVREDVRRIERKENSDLKII